MSQHAMEGSMPQVTDDRHEHVRDTGPEKLSPPTLVDEVRKVAATNVELFRGKQTVRDMIRTLSEELNRRLDAIEKRLEVLERSI